MPAMGAFNDGPSSQQALVAMASRDNQEEMNNNFDMLDEAYNDTAIDIEEQIHYFAQQLDNCRINRGSVSEQRANIFKLLDKYYSYAKQRADDEDSRNDMQVDSDYASTAHTWEEEAQTWDLMRRLLPLKYRDKSTPAQPRAQQPPPRSRSQYFAEFLQSEPKGKELKMVVEWLQSNASSRPDIEVMVKDLHRSAERGDIVSHGWLHTKNVIKQHKRLVATSDPVSTDKEELGNSKLQVPEKRVTQLDPDVRLRQAGRKLAPQDVYFERAVWLGCFELLRRGSNMADIRDWCQERTELWRAASMSALPLSLGEDEDVPDFDPSTLVLWRRMCSKLASDTSIEDEYERAVYGVLSGQRNVVDKVAKSWDDYQFAKYNATLRESFDQYLQQHLDSKALGSSFLPPAGNYGQPDTNSLHQRPATVLKSLQDAMIQDKLDNFMFQQGLHLAVQANKKKPDSKIVPITETPSPPRPEDKILEHRDQDGLRVFAHVSIIISALDKLDGKDPHQLGHFRLRHIAQENAIALYTDTLRLLRINESIPLYASKLLGDRSYDNLLRNLIHLDTPVLREGAFQAVQKAELDVFKLVQFAPQTLLREVNDQPGVCPAKGKFSILQNDPPTLKCGRLIKRGVFGADYLAQEESDEEYKLNWEDDMMLRSMEWLLVVDGLIIETCDFGVRMYKYFLKHQHLAAARHLANRVPISDIFRLKLGIEPPTDEDVDPTWWDSVFGTAAGQMDVDNFAGTGLSKEDLHDHARPLWELECLVNSMDCLSTTAQAAEINIKGGRDREVAEIMKYNVEQLQGFMRPLLKDWLVGSEDPDFELLRETYLPDVLIGYVSTLQLAGTTTSRDWLLEGMELASLIAEKDSDIADLLVKTGRMREMVESFASCSKALAVYTSDAKKGPGASSKKLKEMGYSRELWSVK